MNSKSGWLDKSEFCQSVQALPLVSIDLVVTNNSGEMLLGLRRNAPAKQWWFTPGARVRKNETFSQTLLRVMRSELGLLNTLMRIEPQLMGVWDHIYDDSAFSSQVGTHYVNLPHWLNLESSLNQDALPLDQHSHWRWQSPSMAASAQDVHPYVRVYAQGLLDQAMIKKNYVDVEQFNGGTRQPQVLTKADAEDGAARGDPGEEAL